MLEKIPPIYEKPPSNLCLHDYVAEMKLKKASERYNAYDIEYKCKHCDEIQHIENK